MELAVGSWEANVFLTSGPPQQLRPTPWHPPAGSPLRRCSGCPRILAETVAPLLSCEQELSGEIAFSSRHSSWEMHPTCQRDPLDKHAVWSSTEKALSEEKLNKVSYVWDLAMFLLDNGFISKPHEAPFLLGFSTEVSWAFVVITVTMTILIGPQ